MFLGWGRREFLWGCAVLFPVNVSVLYKHWFSTHEYIMLTAEACWVWGLCSCQCSIGGKIEKLHRLHYPIRKTSVWLKAQYVFWKNDVVVFFFSSFLWCKVLTTCWVWSYFLCFFWARSTRFKDVQTLAEYTGRFFHQEFQTHQQTK